MHGVRRTHVPGALVDTRWQAKSHEFWIRRAENPSHAANGATDWCDLYVRTLTRLMPELTQFDIAKSMMRYMPPKYSAAFPFSVSSFFACLPRLPARSRPRPRWGTGTIVVPTW